MILYYLYIFGAVAEGMAGAIDGTRSYCYK